jgi:hypothetical protein
MSEEHRIRRGFVYGTQVMMESHSLLDSPHSSSRSQEPMWGASAVARRGGRARLSARHPTHACIVLCGSAAAPSRQLSLRIRTVARVTCLLRVGPTEGRARSAPARRVVGAPRFRRWGAAAAHLLTPALSSRSQCLSPRTPCLFPRGFRCPAWAFASKSGRKAMLP